MLRHLTPADYTAMPWANGKGTTVQMLRVEENGALKWRLSRASVIEDGDFSVFPGIERNLTVLSGPGFELTGAGVNLSARPLIPVSFSGDIAIRATGVAAPSDDFNVMTARGLPKPEVAVVAGRIQVPPPARGGLVAVYALEPTAVNGRVIAPRDLVLAAEALQVEGHAVVVRLLEADGAKKQSDEEAVATAKE